MKYKTTRQADEDIINIYVHGATAYGVGQAEAYLAELTASFSLLADNPYLARERPEFDPPVRIHRQDLVLVRALVRKGAGEARRGLDRMRRLRPIDFRLAPRGAGQS